MSSAPPACRTAGGELGCAPLGRRPVASACRATSINRDRRLVDVCSRANDWTRAGTSHPGQTAKDRDISEMIGSTISHYRILDKLGEGGMGIVYKAQDTRLERFVALKFLPQRLAEEPGAKQRFVNEAKAACAVNHPNVAVVYDVGETDVHSFIAMELV